MNNMQFRKPFVDALNKVIATLDFPKDGVFDSERIADTQAELQRNILLNIRPIRDQLQAVLPPEAKTTKWLVVTEQYRLCSTLCEWQLSVRCHSQHDSRWGPNYFAFGLALIFYPYYGTGNGGEA
jgi:hypothetical protein